MADRDSYRPLTSGSSTARLAMCVRCQSLPLHLSPLLVFPHLSGCKELAGRTGGKVRHGGRVPHFPDRPPAAAGVGGSQCVCSNIDDYRINNKLIITALRPALSGCVIVPGRQASNSTVEAIPRLLWSFGG